MPGAFTIRCLAALAICVPLTIAPANADPVGDFYRGRTISLYVL